MNILLATSNPHKLGEIAQVIVSPSISWFLLRDVDPAGRIAEPVEDQPTFEGNAQLKARYYAAKTGLACLADDSGLEVDALGGEPGIYSARYSGVAGGREDVDLANNRKLLAELGERPPEQRAARFVCVLCLHGLTHEKGGQAVGGADGPVDLIRRGTVEGRILLPHECSDPTRPERGRGSNGFGYDPLFELPPDHPRFAGKTTAELSAADKNSISHRGQAARLMWEALRSQLGLSE